MSHVIDVIGVGADGLAGLPPEIVARIEAADFLAGGERNLSYVPEFAGDRFVIESDFPSFRRELERRRQSQRCVVLASGDPLFFSIGDLLLANFGSEALRFEPALSSMQLAFARAGLSWRGAAIASVHGRPLRTVLFPLLGRQRIGLFSRDGRSPAEVAEFFLAHRCVDYSAWVAEDLASSTEKITKCPIAELRDREFSPLNFLILLRHKLRTSDVPTPSCYMPDFRPKDYEGPGIREDGFVTPATGPAMVTSSEIRSMLVSKLPAVIQGDVIWEIGAGVGTVSVEMAIARPEAEIYTVERDESRFECLRQNLDRFEAYNVMAFRGEAPEVLNEWPHDYRVRAVFIGGSGGRLREILERCMQANPGEFLADFVTLENLSLALDFFRRSGWSVEVTEVNIARSESLAGLTSMKPQRGVFILHAWMEETNE